MLPITIADCQRAYAKMDVRQLARHLKHPLPLGGLCDSLNNGTYAPGVLREATILKDDGTERQLRIPSVFDRIAGRIALKRLKPIIASLPSSAVGFRPGCGIQVALIKTAAHLINNPDSIIYKFDIKDFFPSVDYRAALSILEDQEPDPIAFDILSRQYARWGAEYGGVPRGCPGSPFLSNLVLRELDEELEGTNTFYIRYADDGLIVSQDEQQLHDAIQILDDGLRARGLELHQRKSQIVTGNWFEFLGVSVSRRGKLRIPPEAWQRKEEMETAKQIQGWNAHYCFTWRWNQFLRGTRDKMDIVKSLAVERGDEVITYTTEKAKRALSGVHPLTSRSGYPMGHCKRFFFLVPRNTDGDLPVGVGVMRP